jgi:hypothetical protein
MKIFLLLAMVPMLLSLCSAQEQPTFESTRADADPSLDTDPQSSFWAHAGSIYAAVDAQGHEAPGYRTEVRSRWTKDNLYFLFVCPYKHLYLKPSPSVETETYALWNWNVAEVFIGSDYQNIKRYKEFEVSPQNEWVDLDIDLNSPHHEEGWKWNSGFAHEARIDAVSHTWYVAMRIPFSAVTSKSPAVGSKFRINLYRTEGSGHDAKEVMWRPTLSKTFHVPERFGELKLVER